MRFLLLLLPVFGFAQTGFRAEFNYLVSGTPSQGGDYRLTGLYADGDALGFPVDSVVAGSYFYDSKGLPYEIVYSSRSQPLTIEVDRVGHLMAPTIGLGLLTDRTSRKLLPYETSKIAGKLRSIIEVETRKLTDVDANKLAELLDVDTSGLADAYMIRYNADSAKWYVYPNNIDGLTDGYNSGNNLVLGSPDRTFKPTPVDFGTIYIGRNAGSDSTLGYANIAIGANALRNFSANPLSEGNGAVAIGEQAMRLTKTGFSNTAIGREALEKNINGDNNTAIGKEAGFVVSGTDSENNTVFNSGVFIGSAAWAKDTISTNEIVIGAFATGNGSNTATLGNDNITGTYLKGNINLRGYGAGNKEAGDLSKTATNYVLRPASDGTILEQLNNIDGLTDGTYKNANLYLGNTPLIDTFSSPGFSNIGIGGGAMINVTTASDNVGIGTFAGRYTYGGQNTVIGKNALAVDGPGANNIVIGAQAQGNAPFGVSESTPNYTSIYRSVIIGTSARTKDRDGDNEIIIGYQAVGAGDRTATIGSTLIENTFLRGALNIRGYGQGNREAGDTIKVDGFNTFKTRSKYIAAFATDGTLLELDTTGLFGAASGASSFSDLNDIDTTGLQDNYAFRYNSSTGLFEAKANNIDGLDDGYKQGANLFLGREPFPGYTGVKNIIITNDGADSLRNPDIYGRGMVAIGSNVADKMKTASFESVYIGSNAAENSTQSYASVFIGGQSGMNANGQDNIYIGVKAGKNLSTQSGVPDGFSSRNTIIGASASEGTSFGSYNTAIGYLANLVNGNYQIVIGSGSVEPYTGNVSKGPNSAKIGSTYTDSTFLFGNLNLEGYGLGNKEAGDLSKTATNYVLRPASDGTILEQENNIDGLSDGYYKNGNLGLPKTDTIIDYNQTVLGWGTISTLVSGGGNTTLGAETMRFSTAASQNTVIGRQAGVKLNGSDNVLLGKEAGYVSSGSQTQFTLDFIDGVFLGQAAWAKDTISTNEIVIGSKAVGNGSNTATLGNNSITATYLKGTTNLRGYGLGNKEAGDISKTASQYFARYATDGTLIESTIPTPPTALSDLTDVDTSGLANEYILKYNSSTQEWEVKVNNIDGLSDAYFKGSNMFIGVEPITAPTGAANFNAGRVSGSALTSGSENTNIGDAAGNANATGNRNTNTGRAAGASLVSSFNSNYGAFTGLNNISGIHNSNFGAESNPHDTVGSYNTNIGSYTNSHSAFTWPSGGILVLPGYTRMDSVVTIGAYARSLNPLSINEITIGAFATGNGSNTATLGNNNITATYLKGTTNLRGYGAGNKEASDLSKTGSGYFLEVATDGTLVESTVTGGLQLSDLSVTVNSPGSANLQYDTITGVFSYTPPDLSSYLTSDTNLGNSDLTMGGSGGTRRADFTNNTLEIVNETGSIDLGYLDASTLEGSFIRLNNSSDNTLIYGNRIFSVGEVVFSKYGSGIYQGPDDNYLLAVDSNGYVQEVPIGTFLTTEVDGSTTNEIQSLSFNEATRELTLSSDGTIDLTEGIQDEIAATLVQGDGITITYNDVAGTITIAAPSGAGNTDEQTLSINSATAELSISNGNTVDLSEAIDNQVNTLLVDGTNILSTYDDGANTLTVRTTDALTQIDAITFDNNTTDAVTGRLQYNQEIGVLVMGLQNNTPLQLGTDMGWYVKNQSGASIAKGTPVYVSGTDGNSGRKLISPMIANGTINAKLFLGITAETIANGGDGLVLGHGGIKGVNLSAFSANDVLYVSPTVAGTLTATQPTAPNLKLPIGYVVNNSSNGSLSIRSTIGAYLSESHDVQIADVATGNVLKYDGTKWVNGTDLVNDADADPANEIQDLSLSANTLSLSGDATTVDLSSYLDDQTVSLTGAGITAISGTYPNFTITSTEVDGSTTNELQNLSIASNILSLSNSVATVDLSGYLDDQTVSLTGGGITAISGTYPNFTITSTEVDGSTTNEIQDLSLSGNTLSLTGDATTVDLSAYVNAVVTASNGLTLSGTDVKLGGTLSDATTTINAATNNFTFDNVSSFQLEANTFNAYQDDATNGYYGAIGFNSFGNYGVGMIKNIGGVYNQSKLTGNINGGLTLFSSIVDPGTSKEYDRILSMGDATNDLTLKAIDLAPATDLFTEISLSSTYLKIKTPNVTTGTASTGQVLKLTDASTGEVEYQTDIDAMVIACSDETTDIATGTAKVTFRAPFAMTITGVRASLATASSSGTPTVDINEAGVSILGTKLSIDANEKTSTTAATAATITDTAIADDAEITIDIDAAGTGAKGLKVTILYRK